MNRIFLLIALGLLLNLPAFAQSSDGTRQIIPEEFVKARRAKPNAAPPKRISYRAETAPKGETLQKSDLKNAGDFQQLGLTVWRLRSAKSGEQTDVRIIVHEGESDSEFTPERVTANTPMKYGEKLRLSFEAPTNGYLYVIDREQYADGSTGKPFLIFPTTRTRNGDNQVAPGRLIEIPAQDDRPNYFTLKQSRPDNVGELLTVIVAKQPIEGIQLTKQAQEISSEQLKEWEQKWSGKTERFEMIGGAGMAWTKVEQQAGADRTRDLTQNDPGPQTIYRVAVKPDAPLLVKFSLRYRKNARK